MREPPVIGLLGRFPRRHRGVLSAEANHQLVLPKITPDPMSQMSRSALNRLVGQVTKVETGTVMTQVEIQCGSTAWSRS
jgi:hypothetical protein